MKRLLMALLFVSAPCIARAQEAYEEPDARHVQCIAHVVYGESRNEPLEGRFAVAWSIIFRAAADLRDFGGSDYCAVAYKTWYNERGELKWQYDGAKVQPRESNAWDMSVWVAEMTLQGQGRPNMPVMYFCAPGSCGWHNTHTDYVDQIGGHRFYLDRRFPEYQMPDEQYRMAYGRYQR